MRRDCGVGFGPAVEFPRFVANLVVSLDELAKLTGATAAFVASPFAAEAEARLEGTEAEEEEGTCGVNVAFVDVVVSGAVGGLDPNIFEDVSVEVVAVAAESG